jgi:DNA-binding transcriptional MerR regulator
MIKTKHIADRIGVTTATIRHWTSPRSPYYSFMSDGARGGSGAVRRYTEHDMRVLTEIKAQSDDGQSPEKIAAHLAKLKAAGWVDLPDVPPLPDESSTRQVISLDAASLAIDKAREKLELQINVMEGQIGVLETALDTERQERRGLQQQLTEARELVGELRGRLAGVRVYQVMLAVVTIVAALAAVALYITLRGGVG